MDRYLERENGEIYGYNVDQDECVYLGALTNDQTLNEFIDEYLESLY